MYMGFYDLFREISLVKGETNAESNLYDLQQSFDAYFADTPNKETLTIDGTIEEGIVVQNMKYGENQYDEKILIAENTTSLYSGAKIDWESQVWLVNNRENRAIKTHQAYKMMLTNGVLKWKDSQNNVYEEEARIEILNAQDDNDNDIQMSNNRGRAIVQINSDTDKIYINQRFLINSVPYRVVFVNPSDLDYVGLYVVTLEFDELSELDDLANGIAYNAPRLTDDDSTTQTGTSSEYVFSESELNVREGLAETVTVYEYVSDVQQATTFTFRVDGIASDKYNLVQVDGNTASLECIEQGYSGFLVAVNADTLEESQIAVNLVGLW